LINKNLNNLQLRAATTLLILMVRKSYPALLAPPEETASARQQDHLAFTFRTFFFILHL